MSIFNFSFSTIIVILLLVILAVFLIKYNQTRVLVFILCFAWAGLGVYSGLTCYKYYSSQSQVRGVAEIKDPYEDFNFFEYDLNDIAWYLEDGDETYSYSTRYGTSLMFDGSRNNYTLLLNNSPIKNTSSTSGRLHGDVELVFKDIDGEVVDILDLDIDFEFYTSEIRLIVSTNATSEELPLLREFVKVNGFNLRIINSVYISSI